MLVVALLLFQVHGFPEMTHGTSNSSCEDSVMLSLHRHSRSLLNRHKSNCTYCMCLGPDKKCGEEVVKCGEETIKCGTKLKKICKTKKNSKEPCHFKKITKWCKRPKFCNVALTCWLPMGDKECLDAVGAELSHSVKSSWEKYVTSHCSSLSDCEKKVTHGITDVIEDAWDWMVNGFGKAFDRAIEKEVGGVESFAKMVKNLNIKDSVVVVKDQLINLMNDVEDAIDKLADGPIQLANTPEGRLCPAGLGDDKLLGVWPTDCGVFSAIRHLLLPPSKPISEGDLVKSKAHEFVKVLTKAKNCLLLSGPWKWQGVSMPHPFFDFGKKDMCLSKRLTDALDVVVNLIYKGGTKAYDLFKTVADKVISWTNKNILKGFGLLTTEQRTSLPPFALAEGAMGAPCVHSTGNWSMKIKFTGKYKFAVLIGTEQISWSFSLGAGVVFGCQKGIYRTYPVISVGHPAFAVFTIGTKEADTDAKAEGKLALSAKAYFTEFSTFSGPVKGSTNLDLKVASKNMPGIPCPPEAKCAAKRKLSLLKIPSGEMIDLTSFKDFQDELVNQAEFEVSAKYAEVKDWYKSKFGGLLQQNFESDPRLSTKLVMGALQHLAESEINVHPEAVDLVTFAMQQDSSEQKKSIQEEMKAVEPGDEELEGSIGLSGSWDICVGPWKSLCGE